MKQKNYQRWSRPLLLTLLSVFMAFSGASSAWADEITVYDGTDSNERIPINGYYGDTSPDKGEFIIPSSALTAISGKTITGLKFYSNNNVSLTGTFQVFLNEVGSTTLASHSGTTGATIVYTGTLTATSNEMNISFAENYEYSGGNLLVGIYMTKKGNCASYGFAFYGTNTAENNAYYTNGGSYIDAAQFIPKTTIYYEAPASGPGFAVKDGSTKLSSPYAYNFGLATAGTTKTFTLTNPGTAATPISVDVSGANGFTAAVEDNATSIPAAGEKTLTITMPNATASGSVVVTPTGDGLSAFTFNVSGTVLDANKIYVDFTNANPKPEDWTLDTGWSVNGGGYATIGSTEASIRTSKIVSSGEDLIIKYRGNNSYWSSWGASYYPSIKVYYATNGNGGGADWTQCGSTITGEAIGYNEWKTTTYNIPSTAKYIAITGKYIDVDFIYGCSEPLNPTPQNLAYSNVTNASAQLSWTSTAANFNIQYKTTSAGEWTTIENVTANPYTLTGLAAETEYQVKVQANHGVNGLSDYTEPVSFTTKTNPISAYPYTENFNSLTSNYQIPDYWDNTEGTTETESYKWSYNTTTSGNGATNGTSHDGSKCVRFNSYSNSTDKTNFLKTRPFSWTAEKTMKLSFWYKNPNGGDFSVYVSTDGGTTLTKALATGLTGQTTWKQNEYTILPSDNINGNNIVFVFKGTSNYGSSDAYIYLDDVTISEVSAYSMSVSGSDVSENTIAFGTVKNTTTTKTFTINNDGSGDLTGVSVVSSDAEVFTVSDTDFDIAAGATKDITVTFVKAVDGDYSKTITISQDNVATPIVLTVTATYQAPTPATIAVKLNDVAVGASVPFGTVGKAKTKTFTVANTGEATLNITSIVSSNTTDFTVSPASLDVAGGETGEFTVTFVWDGEALNAEKTANITVTPSNAGLDPIVFAVTGTRDNLWSEDFEGANPLATWTNSGWTVGTYDDGSENTTKKLISASNTNPIISPKFEATETNKTLTFDACYKFADEGVTIAWSTNKESWTDIMTYKPEDDGASGYGVINYHKSMSVTAPTTSEAFYLRFTPTYSSNSVIFDNFEGFKLKAAAAHEAEVADAGLTIPITGNQYVEYTASVDVKVTGTNDEQLTVKFFIGDTQYGESVVKNVTSGYTESFEVTFTPNAAVSGDAYFTIESDDIVAFQSDKVEITINAALVLDETVDPAISSTGVKPSVVVKYNAKNGWNTICMPFALTSDILTSIFGTGWQAFEFKNYSGGILGFNSTTTFYAGYPYIVYVETAATHEDVKLFDVNVTAASAKYDEHGDATFQGIYAPIAAGSWPAGAYGVTSDGKIAPGNTSFSFMKGFRAYFTGITAGARLSFFDETTGITTVIDAKELNNDGKVYNLNGQRVENAHKGLYIVNGRKVVVK